MLTQSVVSNLNDATQQTPVIRTPVGLGKFLKAHRVELGLSQWDVAKGLGYETAQYVSNWERGVSTPPLKTVRKLGEILNLRADELYDEMLAEALKSAERQLRDQFNKNWRVLRKKVREK
jgi:transcriptional regulator with XRE-family HTH domain